MKKIIAIFVTSALLSVSAFAKKPKPESERNIWVDCGIGAMLFKDTAWAAVTSNITWDLGTTATFSHMSSENNCQGQTADAARFMLQNYALVEENLIYGEGEHLSALLDIVECDKTSRSEMSQLLKSSLKTNLSGDYEAQTLMQNSVYLHGKLINAVNTKFASSCSAS